MRSIPPKPPADVAETVRRALAEDMGSGDVTAALLPPERTARAAVISREAAVLCGAPWLEEVFRQLDPGITVTWHARDGDPVSPGQVICELEGPARALLTGERTALNFLQTLSGTATVTRRYVEAIAGSGATILDTRKTIPGLRSAQKYAVAAGGGTNHRMGLYDAVLIKENHILAAGSIRGAVQAARRTAPGLPVEVEAENLDELEEALEAGADRVLLDNFDLETLRRAVALNGGRAELEASGNITLDNVHAVAETGVDYISVGALTKHVRAVDLSMRFTP